MIPTVDPVVGVPDLVPARPPVREASTKDSVGPVPFGVRFAVSPIPLARKHTNGMTKVSGTEPTKVNIDGGQEVHQDTTEREEYD